MEGELTFSEAGLEEGLIVGIVLQDWGRVGRELWGHAGFWMKEVSSSLGDDLGIMLNPLPGLHSLMAAGSNSLSNSSTTSLATG